MKNNLFKIIGYLKYLLGIKKYYINKNNNWLEPIFKDDIVNTEDSHTIHYFKWKITENVSVRYFFIFSDRVQFQDNFILKDHKNHKSVLLHPRMAIGLINEMGKYPEEIYGRRDIWNPDDYKKTIIKHAKKNFINSYGFKNISEVIETKRAV